MSENDLDNLFEAARNEAPKISFEITQEVFKASVGTGLDAGYSFWKQFLTLKNGFIMLGISGITVITILALQPNAEAQNHSNEVHEFKVPLISDVIEDNIIHEEEALEEENTFIVEGNEELIQTEQKNASEEVNSNIVSWEKHPVKKEGPEQEGNEKQVVMKVSNATSKSRMNEIQSMAEKAGVELTYKMGGDPASLRSLSMKLKSKEDDASSKFKFSSNFELNIGWFENDSGQAIRLYNDISEHAFSAKNEEAAQEATQVFRKENKESIEKKEAKDTKEIRSVSHIITQESTEDDILAISKEAQAAGIVFEYKVKFKKNRIRNLKIWMFIDNGDSVMKKNNSIYKSFGTFCTEVAWRADENGRAIDFDTLGSQDCPPIRSSNMPPAE